jgi:LemA protein
MLSSAALFWLGLLAVLALWMLGVYNRVTGLRAAVLAAWAQVDQALVLRGQSLAGLLAAVAPALVSEVAALDAVALAQAQVLAATELLRRRPIVQDNVADLGKADAVLSAVLVRLLALVDQQAALKADPAVQAPLMQLQALPARLVFARQMFNDAGSAYNFATQQFPTRLLGSLLRFSQAGRL